MHAARGLGRAASVLVLAGAALAVPSTTLADCQMAPPLAEAVATAEVVFVGTVTGLENDGRIAGVRVDEVWRGGEMPAEVTVFGGTEPQLMEDDRTFEVGVRYVFVPNLIDGRMVDSICTATTPWVDDYAALRPDVAAPTVTEPPADGPLAVLADLAPPLLTALAVGGAAIVIAVVVARRRAA